MQYKKLTRPSLALIATVLVTPAFGQTSGALEEITVTAQKREQSIQDIPISVSAMTGAELQNRGIDSVLRIQDITPNLRIKRSFGNGVPNYSIRGIGALTDVSTVSSSPVAVHLNEVPQAYPVTTTNLLFDLERVEVLRGPQGDLFGLNTTGGTINYITAKPTEEFSASVIAEVGNWNRMKVEGFVSGSLSDRVRIRLAGSHNERGDGWQTNPETGQKLGEFSRSGVRATVDVDFTDTFDASIALHHSREDSEPLGNRQLTSTYGTDFAFGLTTDVEGPVTGYSDTKWSDVSVFFPDGTKPFIDHEGTGGSLRLNWDLGSVTLTSVSGYDNFERFEMLDHGATTLTLSDEIFLSDLSGWSTELRLASNGDGATTWLVGANYAEDDVNQISIFHQLDEWVLGFPGVGGQAPKQERDVAAVFGHAEWQLGERLSLIAGLRYTKENRSQTNQGTFMFGDGTDWIALLTGFEAGPSLFEQGETLTDADFSCLFVALPCAPGPVGGWSDKIKFDDWSGKVALNFAASDEWMLYGSISRGFKSGGFADNAQSVSAGLAPTDKETLLAFEVGAKGTTLNDSLRLNSSVFFYDYKDQQVANFIVDPVFGPLVAQVNAPKSEVYGFEVEMLWAATDRLTIRQDLGYTKGEFKEFTAVDDVAVLAQAADPDFTGFSPVYVDRSGQALNFPEWQYSGAFIYEFPVGASELLGRFEVDYSYESDSNPFNDTYGGFLNGQGILAQDEFGSLVLAKYWLVNARVALRAEDRWELTLFADNLADEEYHTSRLNFVSTFVESVGQPRSYGLRLRYDFN